MGLADRDYTKRDANRNPKSSKKTYNQGYNPTTYKVANSDIEAKKQRLQSILYNPDIPREEKKMMAKKLTAEIQYMEGGWEQNTHYGYSSNHERQYTYSQNKKTISGRIKEKMINASNTIRNLLK